jgi:hypothetical protein
MKLRIRVCFKNYRESRTDFPNNISSLSLFFIFIYLFICDCFQRFEPGNENLISGFKEIFRRKSTRNLFREVSLAF